MGASANTCVFLVGLAGFVGWTVSRFSVPPRKDWFHELRAAGILALFFFVVSPEVINIGPGSDGVFGTSDDDAFQLQLIQPRTSCISNSAHARVAQRRSLTHLWANAFVATGDPIPALRTCRSSFADRSLNRQTHFQASISIHSPPIL